MDPEIRKLKQIALDCRIDLIKTLVEAKSGHTAAPMGIMDFMVALYFRILNHRPQQPKWPGRDRFVLSCGHYCPAQYVAMAHRGYFPKTELTTLRKLDSRLQGHPHNLSLPGIENTSGPLGQGISQAVGMALAAKLDARKHRVYCLISDGETQEGQVWEALMWAGARELTNLTALVDRNFIQIDGNTEDVLALEPLAKKCQSFGWQVLEVDGHNFSQIMEAAEEAKATHRPTMIILHTIPGKGITEIENDHSWHGKPPTPQEGKKFLAELENEKKRL